MYYAHYVMLYYAIALYYTYYSIFIRSMRDGAKRSLSPVRDTPMRAELLGSSPSKDNDYYYHHNYD